MIWGTPILGNHHISMIRDYFRLKDSTRFHFFGGGLLSIQQVTGWFWREDQAMASRCAALVPRCLEISLDLDMQSAMKLV